MNTPSVNERAEPIPSHVQVLRTAADVSDLSAHLAGQPAIALDTEFMREDTYFPQLALLQIGCGRDIYLIDPVALAQPQVLCALLQALPLSVLHSPGEDYGVLLHACTATPTDTRDTQIAAAFAGLGPSLGLRDLLLRVLDIHLDKDQTRSNWLQRPLSPQQLAYAADDVRHLLPLHEQLLQRIRERGQLAWFVDECRRLREAGTQTSTETQPHFSFRRADELTEDAQRRLYRLLHWREQRARATDRPRNWIAPPALLLALAERQVHQASDIETLLGKLAIGGGRRRAESLLEALQHADAELEARFQPAPAPLAGADKKRYSALRLAVEKRASELQLPMELLGPRRLLEPLLRDGRLAPGWDGWRREALSGIVDALPG